jgi:hypothetical protein
VKQYLLFTASYWECRAGSQRVDFGWTNFQGDFDTIREAEIGAKIDLKAEQFHIVDSGTKKIVKAGGQDPNHC